jgi:hypothetical protein
VVLKLDRNVLGCWESGAWHMSDVYITMVHWIKTISLMFRACLKQMNLVFFNLPYQIFADKCLSTFRMQSFVSCCEAFPPASYSMNFSFPCYFAVSEQFKWTLHLLLFTFPITLAQISTSAWMFHVRWAGNRGKSHNS